MDNQAQTENTTTSVTVAPGTGVNVPEGTKIQNQPRPDKEKMATIKEAKDVQVKNNQIVKK